MRLYLVAAIAVIIIAGIGVFMTHAEKEEPAACLTGAYLSDNPTAKEIEQFRKDFGKKPCLIMVFVDWEHFVKDEIVKEVYGQNAVLIITWEPWLAAKKQGIDFDKLITGGYDGYLREFAGKLKQIKNVVYLRFAHEVNGDWYPWSAAKLGSEKYVAAYKHVKDVFDKAGAANVKWVFSVNWEDIPSSNHFMSSYPGDAYVDYLGIDGYNWGLSQEWSRWMSFGEIFKKRYEEIVRFFRKPVMITEFSSTTRGGDKRLWIEDAMQSMKELKKIEAFVIFNVDKETDWRFPADTPSGMELKKQLCDSYFRESLSNIEGTHGRQ